MYGPPARFERVFHVKHKRVCERAAAGDEGASLSTGSFDFATIQAAVFTGCINGDSDVNEYDD